MYDNELLEEGLEAVEKINNEMYDIEEFDGIEQCFGSVPHLELQTDSSTVFVINFLSIRLYSSECDEREWVSEDEQETIEDFLRKEMNKVINIFSKIKINLEGVWNAETSNLS